MNGLIDILSSEQDEDLKLGVQLYKNLSKKEQKQIKEILLSKGKWTLLFTGPSLIKAIKVYDGILTRRPLLYILK